MTGGEGERAVGSRAITKALFEIFIGAHADRVTEKGDQDRSSQEQDAERHEAGDKLIPILFVSCTWVSDECDAADDRGEDRQPHGPMGNRTTRHEVGLGRILATREMEAYRGYPAEVERDDEQIEPTKRVHLAAERGRGPVKIPSLKA